MVSLDYVGTQEVDIPHTKRSGCEVVSTFLSQPPFCSRAIIFFTPYFHGKDWCTFQKLHTGYRSRVPGRIRRERLPMRQVNTKTNIIRKSKSRSGLTLVTAQTLVDRAARATRPGSSWGHG